MAQVDLHRQAGDEALRNTRLACARWLALRRLHLDLTSEQLARMTDVSPSAIKLAETGVANAGLVPELDRQRLSERLAMRKEDQGWVGEVIAIALGDPDAMDDLVLERVFEELDAYDTSVATRDTALTVTLAEAPQLNPDPQIELEQGMYEVLHILVNAKAPAERHIYAIWKKVAKLFPSLSMALTGKLLLRMGELDLVKEITGRPDPKLPNIVPRLFEITSGGRKAFFKEHRLRVSGVILSAEALPDFGPEPGSTPETQPG
jgi:hypothetical protein